MLSALAFGAVLLARQDNEYAQTWQKVESAIRGRYYARKERAADIDRLLAKYAPIAKGATTHEAFDKAMDAMIAEFGDSHFDFLTTNDQGYYTMDGLVRRDSTPLPNIGAWFAPASDGYTVTMVLNGESAEKAGLRKGDVVLKADGQPFQPVISLKGKKSTTLQVLRSGKTLEVKADVSEDPSLQIFLDASRNSVQTFERNGRKIGYFRLWTMVNDDFRNALSSAVYGKERDTDAFILDLRDGFGGRPEGFADPFFRPDVTTEWNGMKQLFGYGRPLAVLINEGTRSAKEVIAYILQKSHRATLVGVHTKGQVLGTFPQRINDWSYLELPIVDVKVDGVRLERVGVAPDISVPKEYDDAGKDLVIEAAIQKLSTVPARV